MSDESIFKQASEYWIDIELSDSRKLSLNQLYYKQKNESIVATFITYPDLKDGQLLST